MAEFVQYRVEKTLPELEQMLRINLFTKEEIRTLSKKTNGHEHKIERHTKSKQDYLKYIDFQTNLLKTINLRRDKTGIQQKKDAIEYAIGRRVNKLYKQILFRFQEDVQVWLAYIKFCKNFGFTESVSQILGRMLQVHSDKPRLWFVAAKWEIDEMKSFDNARQFLLRGLHIHKNSELLYTEVFKLELDEAKRNNLQHTKQANIIYSSALKTMKGVGFFISLLNIAEKYDFTESLQKNIVKNLIEKYGKEEVMWNCIAERELKGFHYDKPEDNDEELKSHKERIQLCVDVYENAVKLLQTRKMWYYYVDAMMDLNKDVESLSNYKRSILGNALEGAHRARCMSAQHYIQWFNLLNNCEGTEEKIIEILKVATQEYPQCLDLWQKFIHYLIVNQNDEEVDLAFANAKKGLGETALPIWRQLLMYYQIGSDSERKVEEFFLEGIGQPERISGTLKPLFLEWLALQKGINTARGMYQKLAMTTPFCLELHEQMALLESLQIPPHTKFWKKCYEIATLQFGKKSTDIWIHYIQFELEHGSPVVANNLYNRAISTLNSDLIDTFESQYHQVRNGMRKGH